MKIVVLDGFTLNPGDLDWGELRSLGNCEIFERSAPGEVLARAAEAEIVLTNKTVITAQMIQRLARLKYLGVLATGYNVVDTDAAAARGIPVTNVPSYGTRSVAQMTVALILELTQHVGHHADTVRQGRWSRSLDFCYWDYPLVELEGLTLGIVGLGRIGRTVAELGAAFGMKIIAYNLRIPPHSPDYVRFVDLPQLFTESDAVSLHCPLTPQNKHFVNADLLARMKPSAFLINTSRGPLIDERALADALNQGKIAGAGLDVLEMEPPRTDSPLLSARHCLVTPHIAWATRAARSRLMKTAIENVRAFLSGKLQNLVNSASACHYQ